MFDHVKFGVSDFAASKAFFLAALEPLRIAVVSEGTPAYGIELSSDGKTSLCMFQTEKQPAHLHLAFTAANRPQVDAFYRAALGAGGQDNGAPGLRPHYHPNYYAAFVIGPDGHNIEVVCHAPEAWATDDEVAIATRRSTVLELRPTCEHCNKSLPPSSLEARICTFECTFCATCVTELLGNVCPNCGGGFVPRPIRPAKNWKGDNYLGKYPASTTVKHRPVDAALHEAFSAALKDLPPEQR